MSPVTVRLLPEHGVAWGLGFNPKPAVALLGPGIHTACIVRCSAVCDVLASTDWLPVFDHVVWECCQLCNAQLGLFTMMQMPCLISPTCPCHHGLIVRMSAKEYTHVHKL